MGQLERGGESSDIVGKQVRLVVQDKENTLIRREGKRMQYLQ
jgi:hypothetical protein